MPPPRGGGGGGGSMSPLTFDLHLTVHLGLAEVVDGLTGVQAAVVGVGLAHLQGAHALVAEHAVARVVDDGDLVLHPDHFGLRSEKDRKIKKRSDRKTTSH